MSPFGALAAQGPPSRAPNAALRSRRWRSSPSRAFVIFRFGLDRDARSTASLAAGVLVATLLFAALLAINRLVRRRARGGRIRPDPAGADRPHASCSRPRRRALVIYLVVLELIAVPMFAALLPRLGVRAGSRSPSCCCCRTSGSPRTGTLISTIATMSSARDLLAPLILLPLLVPLVIAAAGAGEHLLAAGGPDYGRVRDMAGIARPLRFDLPPGRLRDLRLPARGLRSMAARSASITLRRLAIATVVRHGRGLRARLPLRARGRRPGLHPEDLLPARAARDRRARRLHRRRGPRDPPPAHRRLRSTTRARTSRSTSR